MQWPAKCHNLLSELCAQQWSFYCRLLIPRLAHAFPINYSLQWMIEWIIFKKGQESAVKHTCLSLLLRITGLSLWVKFFNQCHPQVLGSTDMPYFLSLDQEAMCILALKNVWNIYIIWQVWHNQSFFKANLLIASWSTDKKGHVYGAQNLLITLVKEF